MVLIRTSLHFSLYRLPLKLSANFFVQWLQSPHIPTSKIARFSTSVAYVNTFSDDENAPNFARNHPWRGEIICEGLQKEIHKTPQTHSLGIVDECSVEKSSPNANTHLKFQGEISGVGPHNIRQLKCAFHDSLGFRHGEKMRADLLSLFSPIRDNIVPRPDCTVADIFRACAGTHLSSYLVKQIHAKIIHFGLNTSPSFCNPLIEFYLKNESIDSAIQTFKGMLVRDSVTWVAIISGLSQNGRQVEAVHLYSEMRRLGVYPTPYVFSSIISACTKINSFELGRQLHALIIKLGFSSELFVCNSLVNIYSRCGYLSSAELIFNEMLHRDKVTFNTLISGFAKSGSSEKSLELFHKMQTESLKPDCVTVAGLFGICALIGDLCRGSQLHAYAAKEGMCSDVIIEGSLLNLYVNCSDIKAANIFFLESRNHNVVLWNVMLVAYGQMGDLPESARIYSDMHIAGLQPNEHTYPSILRTCTSLGALDLGQQVHTQVLKTGFQTNIYICSVLIDMYSKHGELETALKVFRRLKEDDVVSWTAMVSGYAQHDMFREAIRLFEEMQARGIRSDSIGMASAISACAGILALDQGRQIHSQSIVSGYSSDISIGNALVCLYARCGCVQAAQASFERIHPKDSISWNGFISGLGQSGNSEDSLKLFSRMIRAGENPNTFTYGSAVSAAANLTKKNLGKQIHCRIIKTAYDSETEVCNVLVTLYAKCGSLGGARKVFLDISHKNEVSWNAMITGYSQHGQAGRAIELFEDMKRKQVNPNHITFVGVLTACSHAGLVEEGLGYFESMNQSHGLVPKQEHYACVVDVLGRAGQIRRASRFVESMPVEPDAMVWRTLLSACTVHKNQEIGELAARRLMELDPKDSATYVLASNMYAVIGKWGDRDRSRRLMRDRGVKKEPGRSWLEIKDSVHAFFVGDKLHPFANEIYGYLESLNERVAAIGYVQDRGSLWSESELGQKDPRELVHSEKLAVAFGLMRVGGGVPLQVMKNLRVCNDCHNWIKCVSRVAGRAIVVRDAYRFHHFEKGICSCNDYW